VERVEEALKAIEFPGVASVQIIYNIVRQRPAERFLAEAARRDVGVFARVPLASGLLTGKLTKETVFDESDHRRFNRHGESFDVGETFAGVDYETGLAVVDELRALVPAGATLAQMALRWILMSEAVTAAIPGAKTPEQARANAAAADLAALPDATMERIASLYTGAGPAARPPALVAAGWQRAGPPRTLRSRRHHMGDKTPKRPPKPKKPKTPTAATR
jgi:aryl-alcohol dehydrogenase-like predicted oxidoreductase